MKRFNTENFDEGARRYGSNDPASQGEEAARLEVAHERGYHTPPYKKVKGCPLCESMRNSVCPVCRKDQGSSLEKHLISAHGMTEDDAAAVKWDTERREK